MLINTIKPPTPDDGYILDILFEIDKFVLLGIDEQTRILRTFINWTDDFTWKDETILCRKCDFAKLVNVTVFGAIEHYFQHRHDTLVKIGVIIA